MNKLKKNRLVKSLFTLKSPEGDGARARREGFPITNNPHIGNGGSSRFFGGYGDRRRHIWNKGWKRANMLLRTT